MKTLYESILSSTKSGKETIGLGKYKIGMILSAPYQYSARIPHFYEIIGVKGKSTIIVRELEQKIVSGDGYGQNGTCVPVPGKYENKSSEIKCRINRQGDIRIEGRYTYEWSGKPESFYTD